MDHFADQKEKNRRNFRIYDHMEPFEFSLMKFLSCILLLITLIICIIFQIHLILYGFEVHTFSGIIILFFSLCTSFWMCLSCMMCILSFL